MGAAVWEEVEVDVPVVEVEVEMVEDADGVEKVWWWVRVREW